MQQNMSLFDFEGHTIRVYFSTKGEPLFVAKDVCNALGHGNDRQALESHVKIGDVQKLDIADSLGRKQSTNVVNEPGLYRLIMGSRVEGAKRFQDWVTEEVLPAIRSTGSYSKVASPTQVVPLVLPPDAELQASIVLKTSAFLQQLVPNMRAEMVGACTLRALTAAGLLHKAASEELRNALSVDWEKAPMLTPTQIGQRLGGVKAAIVNKMLANAGLQVKVGKQWEPTETGKAYSGAVSFQSEHSEHKGIQLKWTPEVVEVLQYAREQHVSDDSKLLV